MRTLVLLSLFYFLPVFADGVVVSPSENINATDFFKSISGKYTVDLVEGEKPHAGTDTGAVSIDGTDGLMSFSYCLPEGMCDPNDQYFPLDTTTVVKTVQSATSRSYELSYADGGKLLKFSWEEVDNQITLRNFQYKINEKTVTLEHKLHRKVSENATSLSAADFFSSMTGNYSVLKVQGEIPHNESVGRIETIDNEGCMSFSYCSPDGACYPNDQYFPLDKTEITKLPTETGARYEITTTDETGVRNYTFEENTGVFTLKNYQFDLNGVKTTLIHETKRISED